MTDETPGKVPSKANTILQTVGGIIVALGGVTLGLLALFWDKPVWLVIIGFGSALVGTTIVDLSAIVNAVKEFRK